MIRTAVLQSYGVAIGPDRLLTPSPEDQIEVSAVFGDPPERPMNKVRGVSVSVPPSESPYRATIPAATLAPLKVTCTGWLQSDFAHCVSCESCLSTTCRLPAARADER